MSTFRNLPYIRYCIMMLDHYVPLKRESRAYDC